jgi:transcriptional regulator GlxA family with amidase domain
MKRVHPIVALLVLAALSVLNIQVMAQAGKAAANPQPKKPARNLAILIFEGVQIIDYTGPYETFGHAYSNDGPVFNIYTVSEKGAPITTAMGMTVTPKYTFENAPSPDVLVDRNLIRPRRGFSYPTVLT